VKAPTRPRLPAAAKSWRPRVPQRVATYLNERKILKFVVLTGLAGFLLGYLFIALLFFPFGRSPIVTVPDLRGKTEAQARRMLGDLDLKVEKGGELSHPNIREGRVLAQVPLPGQEANRGTSVSLILSEGAARRAVPSITGLGKDEAIALLQTMGFRVRIRLVQDKSAEGRLLGMEPKAGTRVAMPGIVILNVSAGPPKVLVPAIVALTTGDAAARLEATGLRLGTITYDPASTEAAGVIIAQSPAAGDSLRMGSGVRVTVAGPNPNPPEPVVDSAGAPPIDEPRPEEEPEPEEEEEQPRPEPRDTVRLP
jgi:beta-lactam-binding protein with PASTA domain